ncbi:MAG: hypothetical protein ACTHJX_03815 [Terriglobales bacterium]
MSVVPKFAVRGLGDLEAALTRGMGQAGLAARTSVQMVAADLIKEAQANFSGSHAKHRPRIPNAHNYPNVVTGTLRRSIQSDGIRSFGPAAYSTRVGPSTVYARAVELGNPRSHSGAYPYFGPAAKRIRAKAGAIATANWSRIVKF